MGQEGNLHGDWADLSPEERDMLTAQGLQEYSLRLDNGEWVSFRGMEPISTALVLTDKIQRMSEEEKMH